MEENQFFEEMKPLLKDYVEFTKEDMSEKWENMEKEALAKVEESQVRLDEAKQRQNEAIKNRDIFDEVMPRLKTLGEKVYKPVEDERRENQKKLEEYARQYNSRNKELAQANEEVEQTRARIEEEKQERMNTQKEKQESVYAKAKEYIASSKEKMEQDIKDKSDKLEEVKKQHKSFENEKKIAMKLKSKLEKESEEVKSTETFKKMYTVADEESKKRIQELSEYSKVINQAMEELEGARNTLVSFETKYDVIDFASEAGIQSLIEITGWEEENIILEEQGNDLEERDTSKETEEEVEEETIHKLTEDEVEVVEDNKTDLSKQEIDRILSDENIETVDETQKQTIGAQEETPVEEPEKDWNKMTEEEKWQAIKAIYEEREEGREDLLSPDYLVVKYKNLAMKDVDEALTIALETKGKTLVEIYENCLGKVEKEHPHYQRLAKLVNKVKERDEVLQMTESHDDELSPAERASIQALNGEKKCLVAALELMYREKEQNFEDLLIPEYNENISRIIGIIKEYSTSEEIIKNELLTMVSKNLKDICLEQLEIAKLLDEEEKIKALTRMIKRVEKREKSLQNSNEQNSTRQNPAQQTPAGQNPAPQAPAGQKPAPQAPAGQNPAPQAPAGQNQAPQTPRGQNPAPQAPAGQNPAPQTPRGSNPVEMNKNGNIKIQYLIESDSYEIQKENPWGGFSWNIIKRSELDDRIDDDTLEKINAMDGACVDILKCLHKMDQGLNTTMMNDYIDIVVNSISKAETTRLMKEKGIDVRYDLKGQAVPKEVRKEMEQIAKMAKSMGMAKVEKGFFAGIAYKIQGMFGKLTNKTKLLDKSEKQKKFKFLNRKKKRDMANTQVVEEPKRSSRENLGMEKYNINHESAIQHAQEGRKEERAPITME